MQVIINRKPFYGSVYWDGIDFVYTPNPGFVGTDSYIYTIIDNNGTSKTNTNYVNTENMAPVAGNISLTGNASNIFEIDVTTYVSDPDTIINPLTITDITNGLYGYVTFDKTKLYYQPRGYNITDSFTYTISDGQYSSTGNVHITTINGIGVTIPNFIYERLTTIEDHMSYVSPHSADWDATYTILCANSAKWDLMDPERYGRVSTVVEGNSSHWNSLVSAKSGYDNIFVFVSANSANWMSISAISDSLYSNISTNSGFWDSTYTTVSTNSGYWRDTAINFNTLSTDYVAYSGKWYDTYTFVQTKSSNWDNTDINSVLNTTSGYWNDSWTLVSTKSSTWEDNINILSSLSTSYNSSSSFWESTYTTVSGNSGTWNDSSLLVFLSESSGHWDSTYSLVCANSAGWGSISTNLEKFNSAFNTVTANSGYWDSTYHTVSSLSSNWENTFTTFSDNSAKWLHGGNDIDITTYNLTVCGDAVFYGSLTADGDRTELNTTIQATSSLWITNTGFVDAIKVTKTQTTGAIASFNSNDTSVLYVSPLSVVGINTSTPNVELTVYGDISASGTVYGKIPENYTVFQINSAKYEASWSYLNPLSSTLNQMLDSKAGYDAATTYVQTNSSAIKSALTATSLYDSAYSVVVSQSAENNSTYSFLTAASGLVGQDTIYRAKSAGYDSAYNYIVTSSAVNCQINYIFDGGGGNIPIGSSGIVQIPSTIRILSWTLLANTNTTTYVEILCSNYIAFPTFKNISGINPSSADYPKLANSAKSSNSNLTNWVTSFPADTILQFTMPQNTAGNTVTMSLKCLKN